MKYTREVLFCARYLSGSGITADNFNDVLQHLNELSGEYTIVKRENRDFYYELAAKLRDLWPPGNKNGKYPWRDSVENIRRKLIEVWATKLEGKSYSIDDCLRVARKYLSQFQEDTKFMKILKYFVLKDNVSVLANMLLDDEFVAGADPEDVDYNNISVGEGVLI